MRTTLLMLVLFSAFTATAQKQKFVSGYLPIQYTKTINDVTKGNNPWGIGTGFLVFFNVSGAFRPMAELTGDLYLEDDKVGRSGPAGESIPTIESISKIVAGPSLQISKYLNVSIGAGPAFVNKDVLFALKPAARLFMSERQTWFLSAAYVHVYNRGHYIKRDFTSLSIGAGIRIF